MPTTRPRYQVTETDELADALDAASRRWPDESRSRLVLRLLEVGAEHVTADDARERRRRAIEEAADGRWSGIYGPGYLEELRQDWPE